MQNIIITVSFYINNAEEKLKNWQKLLENVHIFLYDLYKNFFLIESDIWY